MSPGRPRAAYEVPDPPAFDVSAVLARRDKLLKAALPFAGRPLTGGAFADFCSTVRVALGDSAPHAAVSDSLAHLAGTSPTAASLSQACWRLAANRRTVLAGRSALSLDWRTTPGWCAVQVVSARPLSLNPGTPRYRRGTEYTFRVLTGVACPALAAAFWTTDRSRFVASNAGFTRPEKDRPFEDERCLVGLRMFAYFHPAHARDGVPGFDKVAFPPAAVDWNRRLIKMRFRQGFDCPEGYQVHEVPCHRCPVGLDGCPASVHRHTYVIKDCPVCGRESYHDPDPDRPQGRCVDCVRFRDTTGKDRP